MPLSQYTTAVLCTALGTLPINWFATAPNVKVVLLMNNRISGLLLLKPVAHIVPVNMCMAGTIQGNLFDNSSLVQQRRTDALGNVVQYFTLSNNQLSGTISPGLCILEDLRGFHANSQVSRLLLLAWLPELKCCVCEVPKWNTA